MLRPVLALEDGERATVERFRLFELLLPVEQRGERRHVRGHVRVFRAERALTKLDRAARVRLARGVTAARVFEPAEVVIDGGQFDGLGAEQAFENRECAPVERFGLVETTVELVEHAEVVQSAGRLKAFRAKILFGDFD